MRKKLRRELITIGGVLIIVVGLVVANAELRRKGSKERWIGIRQDSEAERVEAGQQLLSWSDVCDTTGTYRSGPTFSNDLQVYRDKLVNLVGFMVPLEQFRQMTEFLLLPMPIQCYFCESPPMRDVVLVKMRPEEAVELVYEPILVSGMLRLYEGEKVPFFYSIEEAGREPGEMGGTLTRKEVPMEHMMDMQSNKYEDVLLEGEKPPTGEGVQNP